MKVLSEDAIREKLKLLSSSRAQTMHRIRVLIVDDSVVIRRMVTDALGSEPGLEVVGTAADGRIALAKIPQLNPDVVTLDVEMPVMDGLEALAALRRMYPRLPVIMFSTLTERGATATLDALALGANDYVTKPSSVGGAAPAIERIRQELIPKIKVHCGAAAGMAVPVARPAPPRVLPARPSPEPTSTRMRSRVDVVAMGVSTGGPNALAVVVPELPADLPVPVLIVQHMPPVFTKFLAERLATKARIEVREGEAYQSVEAGQAWVAPGDYHLMVEKDAQGARMLTHQGKPENSCRPSADVLFRSVAAAYGPHVLAVVMTGMGQDGLRGCECVREAGGQVIVQDEATSIVWGMPGFVARAGLADKVLPLDQIAGEIVRRVSDYRMAGIEHG